MHHLRPWRLMPRVYGTFTRWWFQPIRKHISQNGNFRQVGVKINNIFERFWNHHPVYLADLALPYCKFLSFLPCSHKFWSPGLSNWCFTSPKKPWSICYTFDLFNLDLKTTGWPVSHPLQIPGPTTRGPFFSLLIWVNYILVGGFNPFEKIVKLDHLHKVRVNINKYLKPPCMVHLPTFTHKKWTKCS